MKTLIALLLLCAPIGAQVTAQMSAPLSINAEASLQFSVPLEVTIGGSPGSVDAFQISLNPTDALGTSLLGFTLGPVTANADFSAASVEISTNPLVGDWISFGVVRDLSATFSFQTFGTYDIVTFDLMCANTGTGIIDFPINQAAPPFGFPMQNVMTYNLLVSGTSDTNMVPGGLAFPITVIPRFARFIRGDANTSGSVNIADVIFMLDYLFIAGATPTCFDASDVNDSGAVNLADPLFLLGSLFVGGAPNPPFPFPTCGTDGTPSALDCDLALTPPC
jgi:hypothetical protein